MNKNNFFKVPSKTPYVLQGSKKEFDELDQLENSNNPFNQIRAHQLEKKLHQRAQQNDTADEPVSVFCCVVM
jgi:hypothetical protein